MLENMLQWLPPVFAIECDHPKFPTNCANFLPPGTLNKYNEIKPINANVSARIST